MAVNVPCQDCQTPVFAIEDGQVVVVVKHHGRRHVSRYPVATLLTAAGYPDRVRVDSRFGSSP